MEIAIVNSSLKPIEIVTEFTSAIWTEKFLDSDELILKMEPSPENVRKFRIGTRLMIDLSDRIVSVSSLVIEPENDMQDVLTVKALGLNDILKYRPSRVSSPGTYEFVVTGNTPEETIQEAAQDILVDHGSTYLPNLIVDGVVPWNSGQFHIVRRIETMYELFRTIGSEWDIGYEFYRRPNGTVYDLRFRVYQTFDLSREGASGRRPVLFTVEGGHVGNARYIDSIEGSYNGAFMYREGASLMTKVNPKDMPNVSGWDLRALTIFFRSGETTNASSAIYRTRQQMSEHRPDYIISLEDPIINSEYEYKVDYNLGDVVEVIGDYGFENKMRVTEQTFIKDLEGEKSYPTLTEIT